MHSRARDQDKLMTGTVFDADPVLLMLIMERQAPLIQIAGLLLDSSSTDCMIYFIPLHCNDVAIEFAAFLCGKLNYIHCKFASLPE